MNEIEKAKVEKEPLLSYRFISNDEKKQYKEDIFSLLKEYPDNFFPGFFEGMAEGDYEKNEIALAFMDGIPVGCLFFDTHTKECNWLAVSKTYEGNKSEVATKLFDTICASVPSGSKVFWYVNTEDAVWNGKPVGDHYEPARRLYERMGATFSRVEDKFGEGNHAYLVEITA